MIFNINKKTYENCITSYINSVKKLKKFLKCILTIIFIKLKFFLNIK